MSMKVCNVSGCGSLHNNKGGRCTPHAAQARAQRVDNRVYSTAAHRTFRNAVLTRDVICVLCNVALSTVADHYPKDRRTLVQLGLNPNDPQHGRGLCNPCHSRETAQYQPGGWNT